MTRVTAFERKSARVFGETPLAHLIRLRDPITDPGNGTVRIYDLILMASRTTRTEFPVWPPRVFLCPRVIRANGLPPPS